MNQPDSSVLVAMVYAATAGGAQALASKVVDASLRAAGFTGRHDRATNQLRDMDPADRLISKWKSTGPTGLIFYTRAGHPGLDGCTQVW